VRENQNSARNASRTAADSEDSGQFGVLIRRLVRNAKTLQTAEAGFLSSEEFKQGIVFDVEVDGHRYRLIESQAKPCSVERTAAPLSPREREIACMVAKGYPNKTIAAVLEISSWTVNTYLRRMFAKLNVGSRAAMVAKVMEEIRSWSV
jgi:DNA-binding CsgD family transcriptional regulator